MNVIVQIKNGNKNYISADLLRLEPISSEISNHHDLFTITKKIINNLKNDLSMSMEDFLKCQPALCISMEYLIAGKPHHYELRSSYQEVKKLSHDQLKEVAEDVYQEFMKHKLRIRH